jgi:urate oxidase
MLGPNSYGKSGIRLVRLDRVAGRHDWKDLTVAVSFEGNFEAAHTSGDNALVLPTDTMKNTVYALAGERPPEEIESFALALSERFLRDNTQASRVSIEVRERPWERLGPPERPDAHSFRLAGSEERVAEVSRTREDVRVRAGLDDLVIAKTSRSAFSGFRRDRYTTLKETEDRILATSLSARWSYRGDDLDWAALWRSMRGKLLDTFAAHDSRSVQHTLYAMGEAALAAHEDVEEIRLTMPNKHHLLVDLSPFGQRNDNRIFVATDQPYGLLEATVVRPPSRNS